MNKKSLGIIGGMGPLATVELFRQIVVNTKSNNDAGHIRVFIDNNPQIPDRTAAIMENGVSPVPAIVESAQRLIGNGADYLLIPCNTSHYYYDEIQSLVKTEIINMIDETVDHLKLKGYRKVAVFATNGAIKGRVFQDKLVAHGIQVIMPNDEQQGEIMRYIYDGVKSGNREYDTTAFKAVIDSVNKKGAEIILYGCTELPIGQDMYGIYTNNVNTIEVLAKAAIKRAGYQIVSESNNG